LNVWDETGMELTNEDQQLNPFQFYSRWYVSLTTKREATMRGSLVALTVGLAMVCSISVVLAGAPGPGAARPLQVHALQADLKSLGFLPPDAAVDGVMGPVTRKAVQQWQESRGRRPSRFLDYSDVALIEQQAASLRAQESYAARAAENARRRLQEQAAEDQLNRKLKELGFQLLSPVDLNLDWRSFMTNETKVAVRGTYYHAHDVEMLSTPDNKDQPTIQLYTNDASRDARKLMLECRNSNFKYSLCEMIVGATIRKCILNKGKLNEKEIPCLNVQEAFLIP